MGPDRSTNDLNHGQRSSGVHTPEGRSCRCDEGVR
jgi:hypothetical protein